MSDITVTGLIKVPKKLPAKNVGSTVDLYHDVREQRLALGKKMDELKKEETRLLEHIINVVDANQDGGAVGKRFKGIIIREDVPIVKDWPALYTHIKRTGNFELLNKALSRSGVKERWEANKKVPGVESFQNKKLSVTKI